MLMYPSRELLLPFKPITSPDVPLYELTYNRFEYEDIPSLLRPTDLCVV
jgi:hypothetical protein